MACCRMYAGPEAVRQRVATSTRRSRALSRSVATSSSEESEHQVGLLKHLRLPSRPVHSSFEIGERCFISAARCPVQFFDQDHNLGCGRMQSQIIKVLLGHRYAAPEALRQDGDVESLLFQQFAEGPGGAVVIGFPSQAGQAFAIVSISANAGPVEHRLCTARGSPPRARYNLLGGLARATPGEYPAMADHDRRWSDRGKCH